MQESFFTISMASPLRALVLQYKLRMLMIALQKPAAALDELTVLGTQIQYVYVIPKNMFVLFDRLILQTFQAVRTHLVYSQLLQQRCPLLHILLKSLSIYGV
jgi:hypothetical protein